MATKAHLDGNRRYLEKQDHVTIRMPKGRKGEIKAHAEQNGMSLNTFINECIDDAMTKSQTMNRP